MNQNSLFDKIINVISPLLIYLFIMLFAQAGFTIFAMVTQFTGIGENGVSYEETVTFVENMNNIVASNTLLVTFITIVVAIPIMLYLFKKQEGNLKFQGKKQGLYINIAVGIFASLGVSKLVTLFPIDGIIGNYKELSSNVMSADILLQIVTLILLGPLMEELLFRGLIYYRLMLLNEKAIAAYISAIIFGVYHLNLVQGLYTFVLGILLVYVYEKFSTLWAPYLLHMGANAIAVVINYLPISRAISSHWYFKLPVMLVELAILALILYKFIYKEKNKE